MTIIFKEGDLVRLDLWKKDFLIKRIPKSILKEMVIPNPQKNPW